jgi:hypothetical protein
MKIIAKKFGSYNLFAVSLQRQNVRSNTSTNESAKALKK